MYQIGESYHFDVLGFSATQKNQKFRTNIIVKDKNNNRYYLPALKWQSKKNFKKKYLLCEVLESKDNKLKLKNIDYEHPIYKIGSTYSFEFIEKKQKKLANKTEITIISLKGEDGCFHDVLPVPGQYGPKFRPKTLSCKVENITTFIHLKQNQSIDYSFQSIEEIFESSNNPEFALEYFNAILKDSSSNVNTQLLIEQYDQKSSFWVITFCTKILTPNIQETLDKKDFNLAAKLIEVLIHTEEWILKSGVLLSFKNETTRNSIKNKIDRAIYQFKCIRSALYKEIGIDMEHVIKTVEDIEIFYHHLKISNILTENPNSLLPNVSRLFFSNLNGEFKFANRIKKIVRVLEDKKRSLKNKDAENDFNIGKSSKSPFNSTSDLINYLSMVVAQYALSTKIYGKNTNDYLAEYYSHLIFIDSNITEQQKYLKLALKCLFDKKIVKINDDILKIDFSTIIEKEKIIHINDNSININPESWKIVKSVFDSKQTVVANVFKQEAYGFRLTVQGIEGILTRGNIQSTKLKTMNSDELLDINLGITIVDVYDDFLTFKAKENTPETPEYYYENKYLAKLMKGDVISTRIKAVWDYGLFLSSVAGEGLLHMQNISTLWIERPLKSYFEVGQILMVKVLKIKPDGNMEFGLKQLKNTEFDDLANSIDDLIFAKNLGIDVNDIDYLFDFSPVDRDKKFAIENLGRIFEYYSSLINGYDNVIAYLKHSKNYYSSINSPRSHYLNIFISYYEILAFFEETLSTKSEIAIEQLKDQASNLLDQIRSNTQTLQYFPAARRLIGFLEILSMLQKTDIPSHKILFEYIINESAETLQLAGLSKVMLATNLLLSEKKDNALIWKNLNIMFQFIKSGILDLNETDKEREEKIIRERESFLKNTIKKEEQERIEFKSSLKTPILDHARQSKLQKLIADKESQSNSKEDLNRIDKEIDAINGVAAKNSIIHSTMKTLAAFANSKGGMLFIGIDDLGHYIGLDYDLNSYKDRSRDSFNKDFDSHINNYFGNSFFSLLNCSFEILDDKTIFLVQVKESIEPIFMLLNEKKEKVTDFYIRRQSSSVSLSVKETFEYSLIRFNYQKKSNYKGVSILQKEKNSKNNSINQ